MYVFTVPLFCDAISALYTMFFTKHFPSSGHSFTFLQLLWADAGRSFENNLWL